MKCHPNGSIQIIFKATGQCIFLPIEFVNTVPVLKCLLNKLYWYLQFAKVNFSERLQNIGFQYLSGVIVQKSILGKKYFKIKKNWKLNVKLAASRGLKTPQEVYAKAKDTIFNNKVILNYIQLF